jgi:hypothetical protein
MKKFEKRPRPDDASGTRTGPRARAAQERKYNDPYSRAERPARPSRPGGFDRGEGAGEGRPLARPAVITLDPDVARVFRDSETVNEALRMVIRLARFGGGRPAGGGRPTGGRPAFNRDRPPPAFGERRGPPRGDRATERRPPPRSRGPRFKDE